MAEPTKLYRNNETLTVYASSEVQRLLREGWVWTADELERAEKAADELGKLIEASIIPDDPSDDALPVVTDALPTVTEPKRRGRPRKKTA